MWDSDDDTSPASPGLQRSLERTRPAFLKGERGADYYQRVRQEREQGGSAEQAEQEFGWGSNAGAYRKLFSQSQPILALPNDVHKDKPYPTIEALIDSEDAREYQHRVVSQATLTAAGSSSLAGQLRRVLRWLTCSRNGTDSAKTAGASKLEVDRRVVPDFRQSREAILSKRKARGSIMYCKETRIAQIPLYSAPEGANVLQAPALSSFAPLPPLHGSTKGKVNQPVSHAAATITGDGKILDIKKQEGFKKQTRYSAWVEQT